MARSRLSDEDLLRRAPDEPERFGEFYERHERAVLGYFMRTTGRADVAVDLTAETFARAYQSRDRFSGKDGVAVAWLFGVARNVLLQSFRRRRVESSARSQMGMAQLVLDDQLVETVEELVANAENTSTEEWLAELPAEQAQAIRAHILEDRPYTEIARELECSEAVVRKRVSRGLSRLRRALEGFA